ncbi:hypothetical protein ATY89_08535 [Sulfolobus acidocaldarius]|nr:hypothetical protein SacN8_09380 [Sulfolobus acidocaldarius N8]AGE74107.1 hypothetical protein SacRon12I_09400 [Sulfolobus acidocaldarius Ron12/I]ALU30628.1 hypothetical protein ATY89_08535 [Sulfolobus acidocaldarius]WCM36074.1 hypothetical protein GO597_10410 [Sulfolobus acidocaldarius DSM 639]
MSLIAFNVIFSVFWWLYTRGDVIYYWDGGFPLNPLNFLERYVNIWNYGVFPGGPEFGFVTYFPLAVLSVPFYILGLGIGLVQWIVVQLMANVAYVGILYTFKFFRRQELDLLDYLFVIFVTYFFILDYYTIGINWIMGEIVPPLYGYFTTPLLIYSYLRLITVNSIKQSLNLLVLVSLIGLGGMIYEFQTMTAYFILFMIVVTVPLIKIFQLSVRKVLFRFLLFFTILLISGSYLIFYLYFSSTGAYSSSLQTFSGQNVVVYQLLDTYKNYNLSTSFLLYYPAISVTPSLLNYLVGAIGLGVTVVVPLIFSVIFRAQPKMYFPLRLSLTLTLILLFLLQSGVISLVPLIESNIIKLPILGILITGFSYMVQPVHVGYMINLSLLILLILSYDFIRRHPFPARRIVNALLYLFLLINSIIFSYVGITHSSTSYYSLLLGNTDEKILNTFNYPQWFVASSEVLSKAGYNNVLFLPIQLALSTATYYNGSWVGSNTPPQTYFFMGQVISDAGKSPIVFVLAKYLPSNNITDLVNLLKVLGVKYVVLNKGAYPGPGTFARPYYNFSGAYPWNFTAFEIMLNSSKGLKYVGSYGPYKIYEVEGNVPLVYASSGVTGNLSYDEIFWNFSTGKFKAFNVSFIDGGPKLNISNVSNVHLEYQIESPDKIVVKVNSDTSFYLVFTTGYNHWWELSVNGKINNNHYVANGFGNAWLMPSGNYTATIEFKYSNVKKVLFFVSFLPLLILSSLLISERLRESK